jgi:adenylate cyclase
LRPVRSPRGWRSILNLTATPETGAFSRQKTRDRLLAVVRGRILTKAFDTERRLAAIFAADVEGYSRLMGADEVGTLQVLTDRRRILDALISAHRGRIANTAGDSVLAEFASAVDAVECAVEAQTALADANTPLSPDRHVNFRIGVHVGDIMVRDGDLFGDGVNIAARLQTLASAGGVCISAVVHDQVRKILSFSFADLGAQRMKNIEEPTRVYAVNAQPTTTPAPVPEVFPEFPDAGKPLPLPDRPSIAVLPFQNMSGDPEQEYFADGMVDDIITALSRLRGFFVIARNSSFAYKGLSPDIRQVGRELGVRYVLEGSVRKSGNRMRITSQLIDVVNGRHLWAERYDRELADIFVVQDEITESVVASIEPQLFLAEDLRSKQKPPANLDAWGCVARALSQYAQFSEQSFRTAQALLEQAIARDPGYARALALLAHVRGIIAFNGWEEDENLVYTAAMESARRAVALDRDDPWVHMAVGSLAVQMRRHDEAIVSLSKAVELNPNFALAHSNLGRALAAVGRVEEAMEHTARALRISPRDPQKHLFLVRYGTAHFAGGRYGVAAEWYQKAVSERPEFINARRLLVAAYALDGDIERARAALGDLKQLQPALSLAWIDRHSEMGDAVRGRLIEGLRRAGLQ